MRFSALAFITALIAAPVAYAETSETAIGTVEVTRFAGPLEHPWSVAFLPSGAMLVTERAGRLQLVGADGTMRSVSGVPDVAERGQGGLLEIAVAPDFATTRDVYLTYSEPVGFRSARTALGRAQLSEDGGALENLSVIFRQKDESGAGVHFGSRIIFADDGTLWMTIGDRGDREKAQDLSLHNGKVIRLNRDGTVPADNPFTGQQGAQPEIWSYGHRNPQGAVKRPSDGALITVSHGARGGDEVNHSEAGKNYGWPVISYGRHYSGFTIGEGTSKAGMEQPLHYWDPSIAPSGATIYRGTQFPEWQDNLFVGALRAGLIARLVQEGDGYREAERLFVGQFGRIRDVRTGPAGALWFVTDDPEGGLYRVTRGQ